MRCAVFSSTIMSRKEMWGHENEPLSHSATQPHIALALHGLIYHELRKKLGRERQKTVSVFTAWRLMFAIHHDTVLAERITGRLRQLSHRQVPTVSQKVTASGSYNYPDRLL